MFAGPLLPGTIRTVPHRGGLELAGVYTCYRPYQCSDGWVSLGALEPKF